MESGHRFDAQTLHSFIQAVFRQMGSEEQEAKLVADHLIAANLAGHDSHGIGMIPSYVRSWSQGHLQINHHAKTVKESGAAVTLDGDRAFGQVATAALAPIPSVWFSLVKIISRCCLITPPAPLHLAKPASPGIKASPCRQVA